MSFKESITTCIRKYADFTGRARRSEYWFFALAAGIISTVLSLLGQKIGFFSVLSYLFSLAILVPGLAVAWRRLHDTGRKGTAYFLILIPLVGWILLLVRLAQDSQPGANQYGPNPKETGYTDPTAKNPWEY